MQIQKLEVEFFEPRKTNVKLDHIVKSKENLSSKMPEKIVEDNTVDKTPKACETPKESEENNNQDCVGETEDISMDLDKENNCNDISIKTVTLKTKPSITKRKRDSSEKDEEKTPKENIKKKFTCSYCQKVLSTKWTLDYHIKTFHLSDDMPELKCSHCYKTFAVQKALERHINTHDSNKK